ncbi:ATP synthase F0, B subunit [Mycoplasma haemofelis str. Langford 1]|uniref:ATP synthase F0, subunit B n=2 Tax=Mycoplasma haemofelis TaxID=29501 RepID=F6FFY1_MYCHI|nr:ATP synthase F0 subunit B [Mycoplasma haemofelis]AEG72447.1 ATP synthase F0, subunit B [Mycoplasma haemofelis Ohio2]CBY92134.1 ATP synthase F0, B subunit [Mycoplasma haemofelis str. Langford 1]
MNQDFWESVVKTFDSFVILDSSSNSFSSAVKAYLHKNLSVNLWTLLVHVLCAGLIMMCITIWVWKPTNQFIDKNKKLLDKTKQDLVLSSRETKYFLDLLKKERNYLFDLRRNTEVSARKEAADIIDAARVRAMEINENMKRDVEHRIKALESKARDEIKSSVVNLSLELTQKLIGAHINEENSKHVIDAYLKDLEERKIVSKLN